MNESMLFAGTIDPVSREKASELFLVRIEAVPAEGNSEKAEVSGAYANAWVDADTLREAEQKALDRIEAEGWCPRKFDHWEIVCKDCYSAESHGEQEVEDILESVATAFQYGVGLIFHTWPIDETDENTSAEP